ncbi:MULTISPECIES: SDR family NAD(P)-dependent oxidoreductase [Bacteria]|mgnify:CR=1 FL=1|uniref:SDR family NAD(P)-dependent oxidoreductase n=1 Tax=Bacteria TaxID=2 RepID=UPI001CED751F|nr:MULTISPECIES: SDR family oxidoreductase [Bacteria]MBZ6383120.1 SDR family oxidoreductase [Sphingomonas sanguinis]MCI1141300.1 SDR family oxidoreductase [Sphingomonas sp. WKB10]
MSAPEEHGLAGQVAIVTGGGRGLGRAMTLGLAQAGVRVIATAARELAEVEAVAKEAERECGDDRVRPLLADVTRAADCAAAVREAVARFGRLDILVNNAGRGMKYVSDTFLTEPTRFWEVAPDTWRLVIDTNVNGPFLMARAAVPAMLERGSGRIVNVSMNRETMRRRGFSPYGPSKAALDSETAIWAQDLADSGITVNALLPGGATLTGMIPEGLPDSARAGLLSPEIVVPPLLWLCSDAAATVTGKRLDAWRWTGAQSAGEPGHDAIEDAAWQDSHGAELA